MRNPKFIIVFIFILNVNFIWKFFLIFLIIPHTIYYIIKILLLIFKYSNEEICLNKYNYHFKNNLKIIDIALILPLKMSNWISFVLAYSIINSLYNKKSLKIDIKRIINSMIFIVIFGMSWWVLLISYDLAKSFILILNINKNIYPTTLEMIIYTFTQKFNFFLNISKMMRIYKENNIIIFNMKTIINKEIHNVTPVKIFSLTKSGTKSISHPGLMSEYSKDEEINTAVQFTGTLKAELGGFKVNIQNYKKSYNYCVYNICRSSKNFELNHYNNQLLNMGINNQEKQIHLWENVLAHRTIMNCGFKYEDMTLNKSFFNQDITYARGILVNQDKIIFNNETLKVYEKLDNNWNKLDDNSKIAIIFSLNDKSFYDYFNNDFEYKDFDFVKDKIIKNSFKELQDSF
jgi:hypothetical protein